MNTADTEPMSIYTRYKTFPNCYVVRNGKQNLYVTDHNNHCVQVLTTEGQSLRIIQTKISHPWAIAIDSSNNVYVTDSNSVRVFTSQGAYITSFGGSGDKVGLDISSSDSIVVSSEKDNHLQIYS